MRVFFDPSPSPLLQQGISPTAARTEPVVVLRREPEAPSRGLRVRTGDYEVTVSEEALARNWEVRAHEASHMAVLGGAAASGVMLTTRRGPGGESIAVGGKIAVDLKFEQGNPAASLRKAQAVLAAAYAPGTPSAADLRTAAQARMLASAARYEMGPEFQTPPDPTSAL